MEQGRARKHWLKGIFYIQMMDVNTDDEKVEVDGVQLNIDPGAKATGLAVVSDGRQGRKAHALIELQHRGTRIRNKMDRRRSFRRGRRSRIRNRKPRFDNRSRPSGWLPPSMLTRLANTETWTKRLTALFPITQVRVETARFDTQLLQDSEVSGKDYQQGELAGWQVRSYVFHRDGHRCAYCGNAKAERYELDHIVPRSRGGTNRVSNLVVACRECNIIKGNQPVEHVLARKPVRLAAINRIRKKRLADASQMNIIIPELIRRIEQMGLSISTHDAYTTSWTRNMLGIVKTHVNDALCIGAPASLEYVPGRKTLVRAAGHGDRQMLKPPDRHGNPRGQGYRDYCALNRQQQGYTTCPGHRDRRKQIGGIASGDLVRVNHPKRGTLRGYAALDKKRGRVAVTQGGNPVSVMTKDAVVLARNHGYRVSTEANE